MRNNEFASFSTCVAVMVIALVLSSCSTYPQESTNRIIQPSPTVALDEVETPPSISSNYSRDKIFRVMRDGSTAFEPLIMVAAHRGYWRDFPENSWSAIYEAGVTMNYEMVEADIKPANGGYPVVFHDLNLSRVTTGTGPLSAITWQDFLELRLRDRFGRDVPKTIGVEPMTVPMLLRLYSDLLVSMQSGHVYDPNDRPGFVLALDVKGATTPEAWPMVLTILGMLKTQNEAVFNHKGYRDFLTNSVLIKIAAGSLPPDPDTVSRVIASMGLPPNLLNLCIVVIKDDKDALARVKAYSGKKFVSTFEVVAKHWGDPTFAFVGYPTTRQINTTIGNFLVYYDMPTGVGTSKAVCCSTLSTDPEDSKKYIDYRARWGWFAGLQRTSLSHQKKYNDFSILTIDRPDLLVPFLESIGMRDLSSIEWKPKNPAKPQPVTSSAF